jgi:L-arabinose isomerase
MLAGGPHHTSFTQALTADYLESFAEMSDVEFLHINDETTLADFKNHLRWNQAYWHLVGGC